MRCVALLFAILFTGRISAQIPTPFIYTMTDGLPSERIFCAAQDKRGFIWLGTDAGLCFFNGRDFLTYSVRNGLADNHISRIYADRSNRLWIFHPSGKISLYHNGMFYNSASSRLLARIESRKIPQNIMEDMFGNLWFGYAGGALSKLSSADALVFFASPHPGEFHYAPEFYLTSDNELWVIYSANFYNFNYDSEEFDLLLGPVIQAQNKLVYHFISPSNAIFMTAKGIERMINKNYGIVISQKRIVSPEQIQHIHYDHNNNIWLSSALQRSYFYFYDKGVYRDGFEILSGIQVNAYYTDLENNLWVCTDGSGLYRFSASSLSGNFLTSLDGLPSDRVARLLPWSNDQFIAVTADGSSTLINDKKIRLLSGPLPGTVSIIADADTSSSVFMIAENSRLMVYRNQSARIFSLDYLMELNEKKDFTKRINDLIFDGKKWMLAVDSIIYSIHLNSLVPKLKKEYSAFSTIAKIKPFFNEKLLAVIDQTVYDISSIPPLPFSQKINSSINDFYFSNDSLLLIASAADGLLGYRTGKQVFQFNEFNGYPIGSIYRISVSREGVTWLATQTGVYRLLINNSSIESSEQFTNHDGLLSNSVNDVLAGNRLVTAGYRGINFFPGSMIKYLAEPPQVFLKQFNYDFKTYSLSDSMKFKYRKGPLHIEFESPVYHSPEEVRYQYKLNGFNEEWTETENTFAEYSSLDPGTYIFQVQAKKANSGWSKPVFIKFEIIAPFYGTLWFRLIIANTLVFILYMLLRNMVSAKFRKRLAVYERERALEQERNRISRDMHDDLGADLTNIVILSKIARQTIKPKVEERDAIDRIEHAANDVINKMNEIIWALNPSNDTLSNLIAYLHRYLKENLENAQIEFEVTIPSRIPNVHLKAGYRRNIFLVVKESVHNAVKHAAAGMIKTDILLPDKKTLKIIITDNGSGFNVSERTGSGNGLLNMKKRMHEINGVYTIESTIGKGTTVILEVPLPA